MNNTLMVVLAGAAALLAMAAFMPDEKRVIHQINGNGFNHTLETKTGMTTSLSTVGRLETQADGKDIYVEKNGIKVVFASGYDFNIFREALPLKKAYADLQNPDYSQTDFELLEEGEDFIIYKAMEGDLPFHSVLVSVKAGNENFSAVTEQIHFDENDKALVLGLEDCREVVKILRSIKKAK